jgi:hypothetical protein
VAAGQSGDTAIRPTVKHDAAFANPICGQTRHLLPHASMTLVDKKQKQKKQKTTKNKSSSCQVKRLLLRKGENNPLNLMPGATECDIGHKSGEDFTSLRQRKKITTSFDIVRDIRLPPHPPRKKKKEGKKEGEKRRGKKAPNEKREEREKEK